MEKISYEFVEKYLINSNFMYLAEQNQIKYSELNSLRGKDLCLFEVNEVTFEESSPRKEALENVLSSIRIDGINFIFLIIGDKKGVKFYYGISKDCSSSADLKLSIQDIGKYILKSSLQGNFRGSKITELSPDDKTSVVNHIGNMKYSGMIEGVPGSNKDDEKFQSVDRLVDVMLGDIFAFMIIAKPLNHETARNIQSDMYALYSKIAPFSKKNIQSGKSKNQGYSSSTSKGNSETTGISTSTSATTGNSKSESSTTGRSKGTSEGTSNGSSSNSTSKGGNESKSESKTSQEGISTSESKTKGNSSSVTTTQTGSESNSNSEGTSETTSVEFINKEVQEWIKYIDEVLLPRIDYGKGKGMFVSAITMFSDNAACLKKLQNTAMSLYAGETGNRVPLKAVTLNKKETEILKNFRLPYGTIGNLSNRNEKIAHSAMSQVIDKNGYAYLGNWITTNELSVIAGLPQKEIVGLSLNEEVEFGLNSRQKINDENKIELGNLVLSGNVLKENKVYLDKNVLDQHIFISGVTGSGKTTTCQNILLSSDTPFLVIEPAKTEYRILKENVEDLLVFTLGKNTVAPLKMNPFIFFKHESITSRVDMIKACIESAFDMEAAIPQIIESAIYKSYEDYGWNIATNKNSRFADPFSNETNAFPTLQDLLRNTKTVIEIQGFDERLKNDYIGSINARLQGLLVGSKGLMLNTHSTVDFEELLEHNVVFELEEIRSGAEKSLIMGFILINLAEAIKAKYKKTGKFKHITLVEEAHRLLSKYQSGDDPNKRHGVEMFTDMLAEIRKYGESLIIVDQIPNKLTSEVLKNTNTKIIHRIFAADDKDAIGNTVMLKKEQKEFLSNLETGRAVFFTPGIDKALQVQIKQSVDTSRKSPDDDELIEAACTYYSSHYKDGFIAGLELFDCQPEHEQCRCMMSPDMNCDIYEMFDCLGSNKNKMHLLPDNLRERITKYIEIIGKDVFIRYVKKYIISNYRYSEFDDEAFETIRKYYLDKEEDITQNLSLAKIISEKFKRK